MHYLSDQSAKCDLCGLPYDTELEVSGGFSVYKPNGDQLDQYYFCKACTEKIHPFVKGFRCAMLGEVSP